MIKDINKCSGYEGCAAPLCPLDTEGLPHAIFYPDEEVCNSRKFAKLHWVRIQKRIRKLRLKATAGYFTYKMLDSVKAVSKSIKGIDPDSYASIDVWLGRRSAMPTPTIPVFAQKVVDSSFAKKNSPPKGYKGTEVRQLVLIQ